MRGRLDFFARANSFRYQCTIGQVSDSVRVPREFSYSNINQNLLSHFVFLQQATTNVARSKGIDERAIHLGSPRLCHLP